MPSFDVVSEVDAPEINNAVENAKRELTTRFDFRGVDADISCKDEVISLKAESEMQCQQLLDIARRCLTKRGIDPYAVSADPNLERSGKNYIQKVTFKQGIEQPMAKKIVKLIKDNKLKVQAAIQGDELRVTGKKRDDLQAVMKLIREGELGQPFQFKNFRD